ncbi:MAG: glycerate kinase [Thermoprotei archaeon]|nr:MAG: glycerate kinase [Thermoprotei archaeon]
MISRAMIRNVDELRVAPDDVTAKAREIAIALLEAGLKAADPVTAIERNVVLEGEKLRIRDLVLDLSKYDRVLVVGGGKASAAMAYALEKVLDKYITAGLVVVPRGLAETYRTEKIRLLEGTHPIPSEVNRKHCEEIIELLKQTTERDLVICLISGGGSALLCCPYDTISMEDMMMLTKILLKCGANINEINVVRKHVEKLKGGRLAKLAHPATVVSLIVSDVVGDPLDTIASGPTAPDPSTYSDAISILKRYGVWDEVPESVREVLSKGARGELEESPGPEDPVFMKVHNVIIASNELSLKAMEQKARELGLNTLVLTSYLEGEAKEVGKVLASLAKQVHFKDYPLKRPCALIAGGETTVTLPAYGVGLGGRNQELALSAALMIRGLRGVVIASMGTDGIDGNSDAAGAIVDGYTVDEALKKGLDPYDHLAKHDSYTFFKKLGRHLIMTGPTGTNVNDIMTVVCL